MSILPAIHVPPGNGTDGDFDFLSMAFASDTSFERLLRNRTFSDYFNTFLSLPVFAVRVLYRRDNNKFELDMPLTKNPQHMMEDKVITWVRTNRAPLFLKSPICNEYRFCAQLLELSVCLSLETYYDKEDIERFQSKYLAKVIDMQRFKSYLGGTFGEGLVNFWLDAEKFRRQMPDACRRFALKDIYEKYLSSGGISELSFSVRENIIANLKDLWEKKGKLKSTYINGEVLVETQKIVLKSLQDYWIPKYVYHRLKRRGLIKKRWGKVLALPKIKKVKKKREKLLSVVAQIKALHEEMKLQEEMNRLNAGSCLPIPSESIGKDLDSIGKDLDKAASREGNIRSRADSISENRRKRADSISENRRKRANSFSEHRRGSLQREHRRRGSDSICEEPAEVEVNLSNVEIIEPKEEPSDIIGRQNRIDSIAMQWKDKAEERRQSRKMAGVISTESFLPVPQPRQRRFSEADTKDAVNEPMSMWARIMQQNSLQSADDETNGKSADEPDGKLIIVEDKFPSIFDTKKVSVHEDLNETDADDEEENEDEKKNARKEVHLPLIHTLKDTSKSFIASMIQVPKYSTRIQQPYSKTFVKENMLTIVPDENQLFNFLVAGLTTDQVAGYPLLQYFKDADKNVAQSNLKFWTACNDILTDSRCDDPMVRQKQYHFLIHLHLSEFSESDISLSISSRRELCQLLPSDVGVTKLMEAANNTAIELMSEWEEFLKHDKKTFVRATTNKRRKTSAYLQGGILQQIRPASMRSLPRSSVASVLDESDESDYRENEFDGTLPDIMDPVQQRQVDAQATNSRRMWRAMELAISICKPKQTDVLADARENGRWTTDECSSSDEEPNILSIKRDERVAGSLALESLEQLHQKKQRLAKLEAIFNKRHESLAHEYIGVNRLKHIGEDGDANEEDAQIAYQASEERRRQSTLTQAKPPRPRCFQDVLTDLIQFEHFKRFLAKEKEEAPLMFWSAVESMRTTSKSAKARQGRTHGIVKRYFGPSAMHGKDLKCNADIIKEIPYMDKVTPAMLVSAQACVSKTLEEAWFAKYLLTFQDQGGATGITLLPVYGNADTVAESTGGRCVKSKTRGLWRMFTKNVISFRRGIMTTETLAGFREFLQLQHQHNNDQAKASNQPDQAGPPRIVVANKLIYTEKLLADLTFWGEVERYKDFADAVVLCAKLGNYAKDDELVVVKKAKTIVDCFIDSQIPPRIQINISNELAENVIQLVQNGIIERGLFHEAALSTFSTLIYFWKKFCLHRFLPVEKKPIPRPLVKTDRSAQVLAKQKTMKSNKVKRVALTIDDDCTKLMFSLQLGLRLGVQKSLVKRKLAERTDSSGSVQVDESTSVLVTHVN